MHATVGSTLRVFEVGDHVDRITIRGITDGGSRQCNHRLRCAKNHLHLYEHPRTQLAFGIEEGRLDLDVPSRLIHHRVNRRHAASESLTSQVFSGDMQRASDADLAGGLLRYSEVYVNRIE